MCYHDIAKVDRFCYDELEICCRNIREKLVAGVEKRLVADYTGSDHREIIITREDVLSGLETVIELLGTYDITTIRVGMGMYLICKAIHEQTDIRVLANYGDSGV